MDISDTLESTCETTDLEFQEKGDGVESPKHCMETQPGRFFQSQSALETKKKLRMRSEGLFGRTVGFCHWSIGHNCFVFFLVGLGSERKRMQQI